MRKRLDYKHYVSLSVICLAHPDINEIDFERFFMFDWSRLTYINLAVCGIDDTGWNQFVQHA